MAAAESDYMLFTRPGAAAARQFAADVAAEAYELPEWTAADHSAALDVINRHSDDSNYIGITDAANVVLADRYRTTRLLTLDQRHFRRLRPLWEQTITRCCLTTCEPVRGSRQASDGRNPGRPPATHIGVAVSSGAAGRRGCRFPLLRRHGMRNGAGKPVTGL
jgi:hypothetical protein